MPTMANFIDTEFFVLNEGSIIRKCIFWNNYENPIIKP